MPFTYREKPKLSDRFRGKTSEELLNELASDLDPDRRMFFDSPSWRHRYNNPNFLRRFPFDDDRKRTDIRAYLDDIAARHPEFADQLKEPSWDEEFRRTPLDRQGRVVDPDRDNSASQNQEEPGSSVQEEPGSSVQQEPTSEKQNLQQNLSNFGLRNTVPLGPGATSEGDRQQRSMSAPPDSRPVDGSKKFVTKCEIPIMHDPAQESAAPKPDSQRDGAQQKFNNAPNVRVIPIQVEGRDVPLVNTNFETSSNYGADSFRDPSFEGRLPRDFNAYQRHSPRFAHKERSATPPHQQYAPQYQQYVPPPQHFGSGMSQHQPPQHPFYQQQQQKTPKQPRQQYQPPRSYSPQPQQQQKPQMQGTKIQQPQQQQQQQQQQPPSMGGKADHGDETDSKMQATKPKPEPIKDPLEKVRKIQKDVEELMKHVESFKGNSRSDKQYLILDELLTRQLLLLDNIETEGKENVRQARKDTIRSIQRCISTLENKVPLTDAQESKTEEQESKESEKENGGGGGGGGVQTMEIDQTKENTPVEGKESQSMEVDIQGGESAVKESSEKAPEEEPKKKTQ